MKPAFDKFPGLTDNAPSTSSRTKGTQAFLTKNHSSKYHQAYVNNIGIVNSLLDNFISISVPMTRIELLDIVELTLDTEVLNNKQLAGKYFVGNMIYSYTTAKPLAVSLGLYRDGLNNINSEE